MPQRLHKQYLRSIVRAGIRRQNEFMITATTNQDEIKAGLLSIAKYDMNRAKRQGEHLICQTKHGLVKLTYTTDFKMFELRTQGPVSRVLAEMKAPGMAQYLIENVYVIENEVEG